jgi:dTMP kinase
MSKGFYVTIEGIDGAGKSTVVPLLAERLKQDGHDVMTSFEPGGTDYGQRIRGLLFDIKQAGVNNLHPASSGALYLSDHIQHQTSRIIPALEAGKLVLQDRSFIDSQRAYYADGEADACYVAHGILHPDCVKPDVTFLFNLPPAVAFQRAMDRGDDKFKAKPWSNLPAMTEIAYKYLTYASKEPNRFVVITLTKETKPDEIVEAMANMIVQLLVSKTGLKFEHDAVKV